MQKGFVNFVLGLAPHRLDYLNITCSWGEVRIRRKMGLGSCNSCLQILAGTKWVLITALWKQLSLQFGESQGVASQGFPEQAE